MKNVIKLFAGSKLFLTFSGMLTLLVLTSITLYLVQNQTRTRSQAQSAGVRINVGDSWQNAVNANPNGTTFNIAAGVHRGQSVSPKTGQSFICESGAIMEATGQGYAFHGGGSNVTIKGCTIRNYNSAAQRGAVDPCDGGGSGWLIENNDIVLNHAAGIYAATGSKVINNRVNDNGQIGIKSCGSNVLVEGNEIARNNVVCRVQGAKGNAGSPGCYSFGWEAGGTKFVRTNGLIVRNNHSHDNIGPGLWTDIDNRNVVYEGNLVENNYDVGIFHEISFNAIIRNNIVRNNANSNRSWWYQAQILVAHSSDTEVYNNWVLVNCGACRGIGMIQQSRGGAYILRNNYAHHNIVVMQNGQRVAGCGAPDAEKSCNADHNNRFDFNTYYANASSQQWEWSGGQNFSQWRSSGQDAGGSVNTGTPPAPTIGQFPTSAPNPTSNPQPTTPIQPTSQPTLAAGETGILIKAQLPGIGTNTTAGLNSNPTRQSIDAQLQVFNSSNQNVKSANGTLSYDSPSGTYRGTISLGNMTTGSYTIKVKVNNSLLKSTTGQIVSGQTATPPHLQLVAGDIDQNNEIDLADYTAFFSCLGSRSCSNKERADFNIDGKVDETDLNIFYSGLSKRQGD